MLRITRHLSYFIALTLTIAATPGCAPLYRAYLKPSRNYNPTALPKAPDYTEDASWLALPGKPSHALDVPAETAEGNAHSSAGVDTFFIHPTTYISDAGWNAPIDQQGETAEVLETVLRYQASAFNGATRVFAPRYRQATLWALYSFVYGYGPLKADGTADPESNDVRALELAYQDVSRAFSEFLRRNPGRPFVLASHSQGSLHLMRLLQERISGSALAERLVAAYVIGYSVPREMGMRDVPACDRKDSTRCYVSWNSATVKADTDIFRVHAPVWLVGRYRQIMGMSLICVDPLSFVIDGSSPAKANLGAAPYAPGDQPFPALIAGVTGTRCENGYAFITKPTVPGFEYMAGGENFHAHDYNLFYMNIRANIALRVKAFKSR